MYFQIFSNIFTVPINLLSYIIFKLLNPEQFVRLFQLFQLYFSIHLLSMKKRHLKRNFDDDDYVIYTQTKRRRKVTKRYIAAGSWTMKENQIYLEFLQTHSQLFENQFIRRSKKVFRKMATLLRRRDPEQCRSHHQKLVINSNGNIKMIIERLRLKIQRSKKKIEQEGYKKVEKKKYQKQVTGSKDTKLVNQLSITTNIEGEIKIVIDLDYIPCW